MYQHDVVIVGAGTAGLSLGLMLATLGVDVCLVEVKERSRVGEKVCGDAISGHHFLATSLPEPKGEALRLTVDTIKIYGRDLRYFIKLTSKHGGFIVDRRLYGQQLLKCFEERGGKLYDCVKAVDLIVEDGFAKGVKAIDLRSNELKSFRSKIVVDATGYTATLLRRAPDSWGVEKSLEKRDIIVAYREIVKIKEPIWDVESLHIHFYSRYAPGGYVWIFPWSADGRYLNIGNGAMAEYGSPNLRELLSRYLREVHGENLSNREVIEAGAWNIPNRRPRNVFVGDGFLAVGDSAIMIDPATAEGIGYGMYGAYLASSVIKEALETRDYSKKMLWKYQRNYMVSPYGLRQARLDVLRILIQAHSDLDVEFVIRAKVLTSDELTRIRDEDEALSVLGKLAKGAKVLLHKRYGLLKRLSYAFRMMKAVSRLYLSYPETPDNVSEWSKRCDAIFAEIKQKLKPYVPPLS